MSMSKEEMQNLDAEIAAVDAKIAKLKDRMKSGDVNDNASLEYELQGLVQKREALSVKKFACDNSLEEEVSESVKSVLDSVK